MTVGSSTRRYLRHLNWPLAGACVAISIVGIVCIASANAHDAGASGEFRKQIAYLVAGVIAMFGFSLIDYRNWRRWAPVLYGINVLLLLYVMRGGHGAYGAQRWIPLGPLGELQPSEPVKLIMAIAVATVLCQGHYDRLRDLWKPLLTFAIPALLVLKQPDFGTTLVLLAILSAQLFVGLPKIAHFLAYAAGALAVAGVTLGTNLVLKPFQRARLFVFLNPKADPQNAGYQLDQSKIAVGNGGWLGRGLHHGTQTQLNFVPTHSRDFIFTVLAEEFGFLGALVLLAMYGVMLYGAIRTMFAARDRFGFLLATGIVAMLFFHLVVNIGMTVGIMPVTGIPLPFMSYGGSAMLADFAAVGVLLNIYAQRGRDVLGNA
ncbi:MAG TPA: rod shape-determining protein RodA [Candidatus Baltobacteraceae bacterium]